MSAKAWPIRIKGLVARAIDRVSPGFVERSEVGKFAIRSVSPLATPISADRFAPGERLPAHGIRLDRQQQEALVREIREHADLFPLIRTSPTINTQYHTTGDKIRNGYFPTPDAETYAGMIAVHRPARIVEIGGGFSTLVARTAIDALGADTELVVVDPEPRTDVTDAADRVLLHRVEEVEADVLDIGSGSFLFIDSSHVLRSGGDLPFLYGDLVPRLPSDVTVHVHDIYLPYEYSELGLDLWWNEQYLLQALLAHSPRYEVLLALRWLSTVTPELMADVYGSCVADDPAHGGGSFWFRTTGWTDTDATGDSTP